MLSFLFLLRINSGQRSKFFFFINCSYSSGANAKLRYQITSGNVGGVFDMEPEVGTIFIAQPLDYEQNKLYKLHILASDGKWEDYATVIVTIVNKNDEAPVFSVNEYYGSVTEELDGSPVFVLQVMPLDSLYCTYHLWSIFR